MLGQEVVGRSVQIWTDLFAGRRRHGRHKLIPDRLQLGQGRISRASRSASAMTHHCGPFRQARSPPHTSSASRAASAAATFLPVAATVPARGWQYGAAAIAKASRTSGGAQTSFIRINRYSSGDIWPGFRMSCAMVGGGLRLPLVVCEDMVVTRYFRKKSLRDSHGGF